MNRIAMAIGSDGKLAEFFSVMEVLIYERQNEWLVAERFRIPTKPDMDSAAAVRLKAENIAKNILVRNCNNIVGREIIGIPYHILCKEGLEVFEADEISRELFDEIYEDFLTGQEDTSEATERIPPRPIPADDEGNYFFDFMKAVKCHPELSSKKMLIPFLANDLFFSLLIRCEHVMPWLDDFIKVHGLNMEAKRENGAFQVLITHKNCNER